MSDFTFIKHGTFNFQAKDISGGTGKAFAYAFVPVDASGNVITGGGGGGGAITAASGSYASGALSAGAITDLGTGATPGANTTNGILKIINTTLGSPLQAGGNVNISNATLAVTQSGTWSDTVTQATAANLNAQVVGAVAHLGANSGNPVKGGAVYNSSSPSPTTGEIVDLQTDNRANLRVCLASGGVLATLYPVNADANATTAGYVLGVNYGYNNSAYDRIRTITGALNDGTGLGVTAVEQAGALYNNITSAATTTVKSGKGILHKLVINTPVASATITIYDNTAGSGTKIGTITLPATITGEAPVFISYDLQFSTGLTLVTSGATDITVIYR